MKNLKYTFNDACSIFDYHERTGLLPRDMSAEEFKALKETYGLVDDDEDFIDPAGGSGLHSHI